MNMIRLKFNLVMLTLCLLINPVLRGQENLRLNDMGYFHKRGLDITVFSDYYPDGHQSGVTVIQHGNRVAANGDLRLIPLLEITIPEMEVASTLLRETAPEGNPEIPP